MKIIKKQEVLQKLQNWENQGNTVTDFLYRAIKNEMDICYELNLTNPNTFLFLVIGYLPQIDILTPSSFFLKKNAALKSMAKKIIANELSFKKLASKQVKGYYSAKWFKSCQEIYENFSYEKMGTLYLLNCNKKEIKDAPQGTYRLTDGTHRTLVLAYKILKGEINYQPLPAILLTPRAEGLKRFWLDTKKMREKLLPFLYSGS